MKNAFILFLLFPFTVLAQDLTLGSTYKLDVKEGIYNLIHHEKGEFYVHRQSNKVGAKKPPIIEKYDENMELVYSNTIKEYDVKNVSYSPFFSISNRIFMGVKAKNITEKEISCSFVEIDKKNGGLTGKKIELGKVRVEKKSKKMKLEYVISQDSSKLVTLLEKFDEATERYEIIFKVFDENLNEIWTKKVQLKKEDEFFNILEYKVDNEGNLYMLMEKDKITTDESPTEFYHKLLLYQANVENKTEYGLNLESDKLISNVTFNIKENGDLVFSGLYSDSFRVYLTGAFYFLMDSKDKMKIKENYKKFGENELSLYLSKSKIKKGKPAINHFKLNDLILRSDGSTTLIAEDFKTVDVPYNSNGKSYTQKTPHFGPIMIVNIDADGQIEWVSQIKKYQNSGGATWGSYSMGVDNDNLHFVYNMGYKSGVMLTSVDKTGKMEEKELVQLKKKGQMIVAKVCTQISENKMILYSLKGNDYNFGLLRF